MGATLLPSSDEKFSKTQGMINQAALWMGLLNYAHLLCSAPTPPLFKPKTHVSPRNASTLINLLSLPFTTTFFFGHTGV
jgi:hypothetical protein